MMVAVDTSYLTSQVNQIVEQLHGVFDDIGVPNHERKEREAELFAVLSDTLHSHLRCVDNERQDMIDEATHIIHTIKQMEASLDDARTIAQIDLKDSLQITFPLSRCLSHLNEKLRAISKLHQERFEQVKKLVKALESYSSHLEPTFVKLDLPPTSDNAECPPDFDLSPAYISALDDEFTRVYEEYNERLLTVASVGEDIVKLWAELGVPQAQTDATIIKYYRDSPEQLGLHESDIVALKQKRDDLLAEKEERKARLETLKHEVAELWDKLGIDPHDQQAFQSANMGYGLRALAEYEDELTRLLELKQQNLHVFVEDARCKLQELWDSLYYCEEEMLDFTPAFSDVYSDALLSAHEVEIARLETLKKERSPILTLIEKHKSIIEDKETLAASSQDASRLMSRGNNGQKRDPTRLLREEKMRKRIAKELPKVEAELRSVLQQWEDENGHPFLVHGERYLDDLAAAEKKQPPRSKTPGAYTRPATAAGVRPTPLRTGAKSGENTLASTVRGGAPSRLGGRTPTIGRGTARKFNAATVGPALGGRLSPSKIPTPKAEGASGAHSPERKTNKPNFGTHGPLSSTAMVSNPRGSARLPPRAPPPKIRDLFKAPQPQETPQLSSQAYFTGDDGRSASAFSMSFGSSAMRGMSPDEVYSYDDHSQGSYMTGNGSKTSSGFSASGSLPGRMRPKSQNAIYSAKKPTLSAVATEPETHPYDYGADGYQAPTSADAYVSRISYAENPSHSSMNTSSTSISGLIRQISNSSSAYAGTSCSENWETYDYPSEPETDATEVYYAKLRETQKRIADADSGVTGKKTKGAGAAEDDQTEYAEHVLSEDDALWADQAEGY